MTDFKMAAMLIIYSKMQSFLTVLHLCTTILHFFDGLWTTRLYCDSIVLLSLLYMQAICDTVVRGATF